jgi:signal transduction histidine kinase
MDRLTTISRTNSAVAPEWPHRIHSAHVSTPAYWCYEAAFTIRQAPRSNWCLSPLGRLACDKRPDAMPGTRVERITDPNLHTRHPLQARTRVVNHPDATYRLARASDRNDEPGSDSAAAVLQERARITRELHDTVSQTLYAISLGVVRARSLLDETNGEVQGVIDDVLQLANDGQAELRALLTEIRPRRLTSGGFLTAMHDVVVDMQRRSGLEIRLTCRCEPSLPEATTEAVVMIIREALHNVARHANATRAEIELKFDSAQLVILIRDDGRGFDPAKAHPGHFGLQSMRERADAVGATLALVSGVGRGTQIHVTVPAQMDSDG